MSDQRTTAADSAALGTGTGWTLLAALGFVMYFLGALLAHVRKRQPIKDMAPATILLVLSILVTILQFAR